MGKNRNASGSFGLCPTILMGSYSWNPLDVRPIFLKLTYAIMARAV